MVREVQVKVAVVMSEDCGTEVRGSMVTANVIIGSGRD